MSASDELKTSSLYTRDLIDVTRQNFQVFLNKIYSNIQKAIAKQDEIALALLHHEFREILIDMDAILKTDCSQTLGAWIEQARKLAIQVDDEKIVDLYESNARYQITLWGPRGEINDYASKQWSGLISDYYLLRWEILFEELSKVITSGKSIDEANVKNRIRNEVEIPFVKSTNYTIICGGIVQKYYINGMNCFKNIQISGDAVEKSKQFYIKWVSRISELKLPRLKVYN